MERGGAYTLIGRLKLTTETERKRTSAGGARVSDGQGGCLFLSPLPQLRILGFWVTCSTLLRAYSEPRQSACSLQR